MELEIWSEPKDWLGGLCPRRRQPYLGPYPTTVLTLQPPAVLITANSWIYVVDVEKMLLLHSACLRGRILRVSSGKRMVVAVTQSSIELLNERLERVRTFPIAGEKVSSLASSSRGFVILYEGEQLPSHPLIRFVPVRPASLSGYHDNHRFCYADQKVWVENI